MRDSTSNLKFKLSIEASSEYMNTKWDKEKTVTESKGMLLFRKILFLPFWISKREYLR